MATKHHRPSLSSRSSLASATLLASLTTLFACDPQTAEELDALAPELELIELDDAHAVTLSDGPVSGLELGSASGSENQEQLFMAKMCLGEHGEMGGGRLCLHSNGSASTNADGFNDEATSYSFCNNIDYDMFVRLKLYRHNDRNDILLDRWVVARARTCSYWNVSDSWNDEVSSFEWVFVDIIDAQPAVSHWAAG